MSKTLDEYVEQYGQGVDYSAAKDEFRGMMESLFDAYPDLLAVSLKGWTPGFNDGDPCTHSEEMIAVFRDYILSDDTWHEYSGDEDIELSGGVVKAADLSPTFSGVIHTPRSIIDGKGGRYDRSVGQWVDYLVELPSLVPAAKLLAYQPLSHHGWDTDYILFVSRTDDGINIEHDHYDCGY
jgi:hypothetical protein